MWQLVNLCTHRGWEAADFCRRSVGLVLDALDVVRHEMPAARVACPPAAFAALDGRALFLDWLKIHYLAAAAGGLTGAADRVPPVSSAFAVVSALRERFPCAERSG